MIIYEPKLVVTEHCCSLETEFEANGKNGTLWYKFPIEFKEYIVVEQSDSAIIGLLVLAMKNGEDIYLKGTMSSRLYYALTTYLIRAIDLAYSDYQSIKIFPDNLSDKVFNTKNISVTGVSCGVDSFSTIATHLDLGNSFDLKYLTFFNAGSHGEFDGELAKEVCQKRLSNAKAYANSVNLSLIEIESNVMDVLEVNFQSLHTLIHLSCVLNLQKLIRTYYYASSFRFDFYTIYGINSSWDILILNLLETESNNFYSSVSQFTRFERTEIISKYEPSYKYLDVCTAPHIADKINCSKCEKCLRTQVSLELIGKLYRYKDVFNLKVYEQYKDKYIAGLVSKKNLNQINQELYLKLNSNGEIELKHYFMSTISLLRNKFYNLKRLLKYVD